MGLAGFAGSKFQRMANWPSFDYFYRNGVKLHDTGHRFRGILPVSIFLRIETGPVAHPLEFETAKSANPIRFLSKIDQSLIAGEGDVFQRPREKKPAKVLKNEKSCFVFWNDKANNYRSRKQKTKQVIPL